LEVLVFFGPVE